MLNEIRSLNRNKTNKSNNRICIVNNDLFINNIIFTNSNYYKTIFNIINECKSTASDFKSWLSSYITTSNIQTDNQLYISDYTCKITYDDLFNSVFNGGFVYEKVICGQCTYIVGKGLLIMIQNKLGDCFIPLILVTIDPIYKDYINKSKLGSDNLFEEIFDINLSPILFKSNTDAYKSVRIAFKNYANKYLLDKKYNFILDEGLHKKVILPTLPKIKSIKEKNEYLNTLVEDALAEIKLNVELV